MDLQLSGKTALVTGSTGGIGYSIAQVLLREGAQVSVNGRTQESVDKAASLKELTGKIPLTFPGDMSKAEDWSIRMSCRQADCFRTLAMSRLPAIPKATKKIPVRRTSISPRPCS
jgi:NAD(P)-dependent dehydrogenase (short-subunit alcohol dehydrogenase family)